MNDFDMLDVMRTNAITNKKDRIEPRFFRIPREPRVLNTITVKEREQKRPTFKNLAPKRAVFL